MNITVRDATIDDAKAIWKLNTYSLNRPDLDLPQAKAQIDLVLKKGLDRILVAESGGIVLGYAHAAHYDNTYTLPMKNIISICVDKDTQGRGVGRALIESVEQWAKQDGCAGVRLVSGYDRLDAHTFYLRLGYTNRKDQKNFVKIF